MEDKKEPIKIRLSTVILLFIILILIIAIIGIVLYYPNKSNIIDKASLTEKNNLKEDTSNVKIENIMNNIETEIKEFTAPITDRRLLKVIDQTNFSYKPQSLQGH